VLRLRGSRARGRTPRGKRNGARLRARPLAPSV
jgi:hypothetical protein